MPACALWLCSGRVHERAAGDSPHRPDLAAGGPGTGDPAAPGASAAVDECAVAGGSGLACADFPHACVLPQRLGQGRPDGGGAGRHRAVARHAGGAGCGGRAADRHLHPQVAGDAQPARCPGADLSRLLLRGHGLSVRGRHSRCTLQPAAGDGAAGRAGRSAAQRVRRAPLADPAPGWRPAAAGVATDAAVVRVLPAHGAAVVAAGAQRQGYHRAV